MLISWSLFFKKISHFNFPLILTPYNKAINQNKQIKSILKGDFKMSKIKQLLSSPGRIAVFALCVILVVALLAFAGIKVGASVMNNQGIGLDQATKVALQNAGFEESDVTLLRGHFDRDDGISTYDIEFRGSDGFDYDYVISANDGTIIEANREMAELLSGAQNQQDSGQAQESTSGSGSSSSSGSGSSGSSSNSGSSASSSGTAPQFGGSSQGTNYISADKAQSIALQHAGVSASDATFRKAHLDRDDGIYVYELEFVSGDLEYDYEIHATTGAILDWDRDSIYD